MRGWLARLRGGPATPLRAARWVVIDCETTGLDPARDALLSVGAVAVRAGRVEAGESFSAVLRGAAAPDNVLVHGIGGDALRAGREASEALRAFAAFVGDGLPVAFHAAFDEAVLARALKGAGAPALRGAWLDLAALAPALYPGRAARALDDWLGMFSIAADGRHDALRDAFATAQLLQVLLAQAERQGVDDVRMLRALARDRRWAG